MQFFVHVRRFDAQRSGARDNCLGQKVDPCGDIAGEIPTHGCGVLLEQPEAAEQDGCSDQSHGERRPPQRLRAVTTVAVELAAHPYRARRHQRCEEQHQWQDPLPAGEREQQVALATAPIVPLRAR